MSVDRARIRELVRRELENRLAPLPHPSERENQALATIFVEPELGGEDRAPTRSCIIEPSKPCVNSGYCKKLGY